MPVGRMPGKSRQEKMNSHYNSLPPRQVTGVVVYFLGGYDGRK